MRANVPERCQMLLPKIFRKSVRPNERYFYIDLFILYMKTTEGYPPNFESWPTCHGYSSPAKNGVFSDVSGLDLRWEDMGMVGVGVGKSDFRGKSPYGWCVHKMLNSCFSCVHWRM